MDNREVQRTALHLLSLKGIPDNEHYEVLEWQRAKCINLNQLLNTAIHNECAVSKATNDLIHRELSKFKTKDKTN